MHVVEYQKRGMPHGHILLVISDEHRLRKPADVDNVISAELPPDPATYTCPVKRKQAEQLRSVVLNSMVHGPCGSLNPNSSCIFNGKCSKSIQKRFAVKHRGHNIHLIHYIAEEAQTLVVKVQSLVTLLLITDGLFPIIRICF